MAWTRSFSPPARCAPADWPFRRGEHLVIGAVGRMQAVKDPLNLVEAFVQLRERCPADWPRLRLAMLGGGPLLVPPARVWRGRRGRAGLAAR
jgi:glycosyltransferase involved in cell wall biosynthesis